jgi:hypothetical protein
MSPFTELENRAAPDRARDSSEQRILSMTPGGYPGDSINSVLRRRLEAPGQAIRDKDLDQLMTFHDLDVEVFDLRASLNVVGVGAYRNAHPPTKYSFCSSFMAPS